MLLRSFYTRMDFLRDINNEENNELLEKKREAFNYYESVEGIFIWQVSALCLFLIFMPEMCTGKPFRYIPPGAIKCARIFFVLYLVPMTACAICETFCFLKYFELYSGKTFENAATQSLEGCSTPSFDLATVLSRTPYVLFEASIVESVVFVWIEFVALWTLICLYHYVIVEMANAK